MKIFKKIAAILLVCLLALSAVGCHKKNEVAVTVDGFEFCFTGAVKGGNDQISFVDIVPQRFIFQGDGIGQQTEFVSGMIGFDVTDDLCDAGVEHGFTGAGKGDVIQFRG